MSDRLQWRAYLSNNILINQFENSVEKSFREVLDKEDMIISFELFNNEESYVVYLQDGRFKIGDTLIPIFNPEGCEYRLIYFKSKTLHFGPMGNEEETDYFLGWQVTYRERNYKLILNIKNDKSVGFTNIPPRDGDIRKDIMKASN